MTVQYIVVVWILDGQLGLGNTTSPYTTLQQVLDVNDSDFITDIVQVAAGDSQSCYIQRVVQ